MTLSAVLLIVLAYFIGSIPFGLILSRAMGQGDLRKIGSGNIGATNALRTGNKKLAALTLLFDMLKGTLAAMIASVFIPDVQYAAGLAAVLGHCFPVWLKFKGGKGVATALGVVLGLNLWVFLALAITWLATFKITRTSSVAALSAFILAPIYAYFASDMSLSLMLLFLAVLLLITHRENIGRLMRGEENIFKK